MAEKNPTDLPEDPSKTPPERPLECTECKRAIRVRYTEVIGDSCSSLSMCAECPQLEKHLQGTVSDTTTTSFEGSAGLACGNCGTTLEAIRVGALVGCSSCYEVFSSILIEELQNNQSLPNHLSTGKRSQMLHLGRSPGESKEMTVSVRLLALNEALNETLAKEDYEQAALLRDQIRALTDKKGSEDAQQ